MAVVSIYSMFETISSQYFGLTATEKKVADFVLTHRDTAQYLSIKELAAQCGVADATISRFCRRLGLSGYNAFRLELAKASLTAPGHETEEEPGLSDEVAALCRRQLHESLACLDQMAQSIDPDQIRRAADAIQNAGRVSCMGRGECMVQAEEAWTLFSTISSKFVFVPDPYLQLANIALMGPGDVILFFACVGCEGQLAQVLTEARGQGVGVILFIPHPAQAPASAVDAVLPCGMRGGVDQLMGMGGRIAQLFVLDVLFAELCRRDPERIAASRNRIEQALRHHRL